MTGIGIDIASVARFAPLVGDRTHPFLVKVFTPGELEYCFSRANTAESLAGLFAAKEATSKALGVSTHPFAELEVRHADDGAPEMWRAGSRLSVAVSITHEGGFAAAVALKV